MGRQTVAGPEEVPMITMRMDPSERMTATSIPAARGPAGAPLSVLAAVTDDDARAGVLATTELLVRDRHARATLLAVMELQPVVAPDGMLACTTLGCGPDSSASREQVVAHFRTTLHLDDGAPAAWPLDVEVGCSALCIVEQARRTGASLVVMGLHRHARADRLLGTDTLHNMLSLGGGPVLAVRSVRTRLPSCVVAAVDFSPASIRAARLARSLMAETGTLHLVFVDSGGVRGTGASATGLHLVRDRGIDAVFADLVEALEPTPGVTITPVVRRGAPTAELTRICESIQPDLVSLGQQRHPLLERLMRGSVAHDMARDARWSMLLTPA